MWYSNQSKSRKFNISTCVWILKGLQPRYVSNSGLGPGPQHTLIITLQQLAVHGTCYGSIPQRNSGEKLRVAGCLATDPCEGQLSGAVVLVIYGT